VATLTSSTSIRMAENTDNIDLVIRVVDSGIDIKLPRRRSTDLVLRHLAFFANAHLSKALENGSQVKVTSSSFVAFHPPVDDQTRFCDFTADQKSITVYALADLDTPSLMARIRSLEAEKENHQGGAAQSSSKLLQPTSSTDLHNVVDIVKNFELTLANAEVQRKRDLDKAEGQIAAVKKDLDKAEAQRMKDLDKAEAQRMKDLDKAERQVAAVKKDLDKAEAQRDDLKDQIELLNREAAATKNEIDVLKENAAATERYIEILAEDVEATTDFLALGDEASLDRIKRRNLLDRAQASLAMSLGLSTSSNTSASRDFREALGPSSSLQVRQQRLVELLRDNMNAIPAAAALLISNPAALSLLADRFPKVRQHGDQVAHGRRQRNWYEGSVSRSTSDRAALTALLELLFLPVGQ